jgi:hypothetical protein
MKHVKLLLLWVIINFTITQLFTLNNGVVLMAAQPMKNFHFCTNSLGRILICGKGKQKHGDLRKNRNWGAYYSCVVKNRGESNASKRCFFLFCKKMTNLQAELLLKQLIWNISDSAVPFILK